MSQMRIAILGNAGAGKSTLARRLSDETGAPYHEVDRIFWRPNFRRAPEAEYTRDHAAMIAEPAWVIDGVGTIPSIEARLHRATHAILVDPPLWQNYWLAAERQADAARGMLEHTPGGYGQMPETRALFELMWQIDRSLMPRIRTLIDAAEARGCAVTRIENVDALRDLHL